MDDAVAWGDFVYDPQREPAILLARSFAGRVSGQASERRPDVEGGLSIQENGGYTRWGHWPSEGAWEYAHRQN